jgi:cyclopropane fatty-acyl-phospholipid synthase-like methyltransferase
VDPLTARIQRHYDRLGLFYRLLWGRHIHHGLFVNGTEPPLAAQVALMEELVRFADLPRGARVLDVGCGLGEGSIWLAEELGCRCVGMTISPVQAAAARRRARKRGVPSEFLVMDALRADVLGPGRFDAIWCVECCEHVRDKKRLMRTWAEVMVPGGRVALCAWCEGEGLTPEQRREFIEPVSRAMLLPGLIPATELAGHLAAAGLVEVRLQDLTPHVARTWDLCRRSVERPAMRLLRLVLGREVREFVAGFEPMIRGYESGALRYIMLAARKPR